MNREFLKETLLYTLPNAVPKVMAILLLPILTLYLSPADYGVLGTVESVTGLLGPIFLLGVNGAITRKYFDADLTEVQFGQFYNSVWCFLLGYSGLLAVGVALFFALSGFSLGGEISYSYFVIGIVSLWVNTLGLNFITSIFQAKKQAGKVAISKLSVWFVSTLTSLLLIVYAGQGILGIFLGGMAGSLVGAGVCHWLNKSRLRWGIIGSHVREALKFGLPLVPHAIALSVMGLSDRLVMAKYAEIQDIGLYSMAQKLSTPVLFIILSLNTAFLPRFYQWMNTSKEEARVSSIKYFKSWVFCMLGLVLAGGLFAPEVLSILTNRSFEESASYVSCLMLGYFFVGFYNFGARTLFYYKRNDVIPWVTGFCALLNLFLNIALIPRYGPLAAAWTTVISYFLMAVVFHILGGRLWRIAYPYVRVGLSVIVCVVILLYFNKDAAWENIGLRLLSLACYLVLLAVCMEQIFVIKGIWKSFVLKFRKFS